jgi:hypothetical protein
MPQASCNFLTLRSKFYPHHPVLKQPPLILIFILKVERYECEIFSPEAHCNKYSKFLLQTFIIIINKLMSFVIIKFPEFCVILIMLYNRQPIIKGLSSLNLL